MPDIDYPYLPPDRRLRYVPADHVHMQEARKAREECAGDPLYPVGAVLVNNGAVVARAGNGYNQGAGNIHVCPRIVFECPSGTGYEMCGLHDAPGHAEYMLMQAAEQGGLDTTNGDVYIYGHWWACEPCWHALIRHGVRDVFVTDDAHERFHRDRVYAETLKPTKKSAYISCPLTVLPKGQHHSMRSFYEDIARACEEMNCMPYLPHKHSDPQQGNAWEPPVVWEKDIEQVRRAEVMIAEVTYPSLGVGGEIAYAQQFGKPIVLLSKKGAPVSRFVRGNPAVVYHVEYETPAQACRRVQNVLRQI
jgi:deoxycytidylate deaminase